MATPSRSGFRGGAGGAVGLCVVRADTVRIDYRRERDGSVVTPERSESCDWGLRARVAWLRAFRRQVAARRDDLITLCVEEVHKTRWEALTGDLLPLLSSIRWHERFT